MLTKGVLWSWIIAMSSGFLLSATRTCPRVWILVIGLAIPLAAFLSSIRWSIRWRSIIRVALCVFPLAWLLGVYEGASSTFELTPFSGQYVVVEGTVSRIYTHAHGRSTALIQVHTVRTQTHTFQSEGVVMLTSNRHTGNLQASEQVTVAGTLYPVNTSHDEGSNVPITTQTHTSANAPMFELSGSTVSEAAPSETWGERLRRFCRDALVNRAGFSNQDGAVTVGLLFGDTAQIPTQLKQAFLDSGLLHVLAASGANVLLLENAIALVLTPLLRLARLPRWGKSLLFVSFAWVYAAVTGMDISMVRAASMTTYQWMGFASSREARARDGLLWTFMLLLVIQPLQVLSVSGVLSFIATAVLTGLFWRPHTSQPHKRDVARTWFIHIWRRMVVRGWHLIRTSAQIELVLLPFLVCTFHQWTPYSVLSNVLAEPILVVLLPLCLGVTLGACVTPAPLVPVLHLLALPMIYALHALLGLVYSISSWSGSIIAVEPSLSFWSAYIGLLSSFFVVWLIRYRTDFRWRQLFGRQGEGENVV